MNLRQLLSYTRKAVEMYDMIQDGDKVAVGLSGGKDSLALVTVLAHLSRFYPKKFTVEAITVDLGFEGADFSGIHRFCDDLNVPLSIVKTDIGSVVFDIRKETNPCSLCSKMRKAALNNRAKELGCSRVALGHHKDDAMESFFMSLLYEGRIHTFAPVTYLDRVGVYAIRPLLLLDEKQIIDYQHAENIPVMKNPCKADGVTTRSEMKAYIAEQTKIYPLFREKVFGAIMRSGIKGWNVNG